MATQNQAEGKPSPKVQKAMERLWEAYEVGKQIAENCPMGGRYRAGLIEGEAKRHRVNPDTARKLRQLVSPEYGGFTKSQLDDLVSLCEKRDYAVAISTLFRLFPVPRQGGERKRFLDEIVEGCWKRARVAAEIRRRYESQRPGDHVPRIAGAFDDALVELQEKAFHFRRWCIEFIDTRKQRAGKQGAKQALRVVNEVLDTIRTAVEEKVDEPCGPTPGKPTK